jgi:hypothetical protein
MRIPGDNAHMKRRVNLTIDARLVKRARMLAHRQKTGISGLVEKVLRAVTPKEFSVRAARPWLSVSR